MLFELFNKKSETVGYKRISSVFGVAYDYSHDGIHWVTPKIPGNVLIEHTSSIAKVLLPIDCFYNYKIVNGKCYSTACMMNHDVDLRIKIRKNGCGCFNMPKVVERAEAEARKFEEKDK